MNDEKRFVCIMNHREINKKAVGRKEDIKMPI
jgi:hypothetical protein